MTKSANCRVIEKRMWIRRGVAAILSLILMVSLAGCGNQPDQNDVTWEFEGNDVRVIENFLDRQGDRRHLFVAAQIEGVTVSTHVVTVKSKGESFKVYCLDGEQANELAEVLRKTMKQEKN